MNYYSYVVSKVHRFASDTEMKTNNLYHYLVQSYRAVVVSENRRPGVLGHILDSNDPS